MPETMVERVARAIYEARPETNAGEPIPWSDIAEETPVWSLTYRRAQAAILAMREWP
jgi:hypothetical protein